MRGTGDLPGATFHQSQRLLLYPRPSYLVTPCKDLRFSFQPAWQGMGNAQAPRVCGNPDRKMP
jgi:hypothetical protein